MTLTLFFSFKRKTEIFFGWELPCLSNLLFERPTAILFSPAKYCPKIQETKL